MSLKLRDFGSLKHHRPPRPGSGPWPRSDDSTPGLSPRSFAHSLPPASLGPITSRGADSSALPDLASFHPHSRAAARATGKIVPGGVICATGAGRKRLYKGREGNVWRSWSCVSLGACCFVGLACEPRGECSAARLPRASAGKAEGRAACRGGGRA